MVIVSSKWLKTVQKINALITNDEVTEEQGQEGILINTFFIFDIYRKTVRYSQRKKRIYLVECKLDKCNGYSFMNEIEMKRYRNLYNRK